MMTSYPKTTSRSSAQHKVCCLKQVEVVADVVHHIPDQDANHVVNGINVDDVNHDDAEVDLKTVFPWNE